ncbi:MAG: U32 family peptidase [Opitutales bacterium]|nr:U32 family peptidase [Opitutales bacterium]
MSRKKRIPEIMSPAGDFICADAAIKAGADAVYFGVEGLNMRAGAKNFSASEMGRLSKLCDKFGVKKYLALNTIYFDGDLPALKRTVRLAKNSGVDAVISWDFAAIDLAREFGMEAFLSTQASAANKRAIALWHKALGVNRFVLARECPISDIAKIRSSLNKILGKSEAKKIQFEVFAHGAMCVSVSGRCFMSLFNCGKSANRGECMQPCRREYFVRDSRGEGEGFLVGKGYVMSPKDLCALPFLEKLLDAGIDSLKIEGRNRNAEYVFETVSASREAVDFYAENRSAKDFKPRFDGLARGLQERVGKVFNRGFSSGFYMGKPVGDWTSSGNFATRKKRILGRVLNYFSKQKVAQISVDDASISAGDEFQIEGSTTGFVRANAGEIFLSGAPAKSAEKGDVISVKVPSKVRKNDRVYVFKDEKK